MRRILFILFLMLSVFGYAQKNSYVQKTNIPTIYIETFNNKLITSKTTYIYATMVYVSGTDTVRYDSMQIRGRGNSTWNLLKKPYRIKFKESTKFLGKGYAKNKSWTLLANYGDKSLLRNAVTAQMGEFLGLPFNPAAHFVDLVLNGTYIGNYQVSDQVNVDNKRVEIFEQDYVATSLSNITGGYLLEIDGFATGEPEYFSTDKNLLVTIKSPDEDVINSSQKNYITNYINNFESLLFGNNFTDPTNGYRPVIDSATVVPWYIATELSANVDGFWSTYIYKDKDDPKLYFGPLWDFDIAYNNCYRSGDVTNASMVDKGFGDDLAKVWVKQLIKDPWFNRAVNDAWKKKINEGLVDYLCNYIDSMANVIDASQRLNYSEYRIDTRAYNEIYLYSTYGDYIDQLKSFIRSHAYYLTTLFAGRYGATGDDGGEYEPEPLHPFELNRSYYYRIYNKGTNKVLDVDTYTKNVVMYSPVFGKDTQLWRIEKDGDYYRLVNKAEEMAFNDPSVYGSIGTTLNLADVNEFDTRQLWDFAVVNENGNYNIINAYTNNAINNNGGHSSEGNSVISYYNNDRNSTSTNRQWRIVPDELIPEYVLEDSKIMLQSNIAEADTFLMSVDDLAIGEGLFCYDATKIEALRQKVEAIRYFESNVADDYILHNVNLSDLFAEARKVNMPSPTQQYVLRNVKSDMVMSITKEKTSLQKHDKTSGDQYFVIEYSGVDNKVYIKSVNGLYLSLETATSGSMLGYDGVTTLTRSGFEFKPKDDCFCVKTVNGFFGITFLKEGMKIYANKLESNALEWILEEREKSPEEQLAIKSAELKALIEEANALLSNVAKAWAGSAPLQLSVESIDALENAVAIAGNSMYTTLEEYEQAILLLNESMEAISVLNKPDTKKVYNLRHKSGLNLSFANGATLEKAIKGDADQCFTLKAIEGEKNSYNIMNGGYYLCVDPTDKNMFMFNDTPYGENGRFVVTQVGKNMFTMSSKSGFVGVNIVREGETVIPSAPEYNSVWTIVEAGNAPTGIAENAYEQNVDYALRYDKTRQVVGFVSFDIQELANVDVRIYTVGGRLLYTFKGTQEQSLAELPTGVYIIKWNWAGRSHDIKFRKE